MDVRGKSIAIGTGTLPVLSEVLEQPQDEARHHGFSDALEVGGRRARPGTFVAVIAAESVNTEIFHNDVLFFIKDVCWGVSVEGAVEKHEDQVGKECIYECIV